MKVRLSHIGNSIGIITVYNKHVFGLSASNDLKAVAATKEDITEAHEDPTSYSLFLVSGWNWLPDGEGNVKMSGASSMTSSAKVNSRWKATISCLVELHQAPPTH